MSETCIVCLGDLEAGPDLPRVSHNKSIHSDDKDGSPQSKSDATENQSESEAIAHLLPCSHNLHDECLKPWVERANSCPICRQSFNSVELIYKIGGPVVSSYAVQDKTQVAEIDPSMLIEEDEDEVEIQPCPICGEDDNEDVLLLCDGCEVASHTYCVGLDSVPRGHWFCEICDVQRALDPYTTAGSASASVGAARRSHRPTDRRTRGQQRRIRNQNQASSTNWARVWQSVWDRLNFDLDFPYDDSQAMAQVRRDQRNEEAERREFLSWERRFQVAERQGGGHRFRDAASTLLDLHAPREKPEVDEPESQEEIRAWNAFEKAKEIQSTSPGKRKRKSTTASPSETEPIPQPERKLKRPRTRRAPDLAESSSDAAAGSSTLRRRRSNVSPIITRRRNSRIAPENNGAGPSFLQSLLKEVETSAAPEETGSRYRASVSNMSPVDHSSPQMSSPGASPTTSNHPTPRALSTTPPPFSANRPGSPVPLTSKVEPIFPAPEFSPSRSPQVESTRLSRDQNGHHNYTSYTLNQSSPYSSSPTRSKETSPTRANMSLSAKSDIQKVVSASLKPHYHKGEVSKDEYTDINRNVSRMLYDKIGTSADQVSEGEEEWRTLAAEEVNKAIRAIRSM
ncbi:MAG: hypothetical protein M1827_006855 [Pycnora praestabilis]|nr:MAG: hypothetical protein M1827_006855 [Pycnora praestabilis]